MSKSPPGILGVAWRLARLSMARRVSRWSQRRKSKGAGGRSAVGRKRTGFSVLAILFSVLMIGQAFAMSALAVRTYGRGVEKEARDSGEVQPTAEEVERDERLEAHYDRSPSLRDAWLPAWPPAEREGRVYLSLTGLLTVLFFGIFFLHLSAGNHDLGRVGWDMEWLFSFPVRTQGLFLAKLGEFILTDAWTWFVFWPFLTVLYWRSGFGGWGLALALPVTLAVAALQAALRLTAETWLRKHLPRSRLKNVQALATILGLLGLFAAFALAMHPPAFVFAIGRRLPEVLLTLPWLSSLLPAGAPFSLFVPLAWGVGAVVGALAWTAGSVKDGLLVSSGGPYQGARGKPPASGRRRESRWFRGIAGKELRLLLRDRNLLVQTVVVPLFIIGMQFVTNPMLRRGSGEPSTIVVIAYGVGAYVLVFGAFAVLAVERKCLWLLFTFPQRLGGLLRQKVKLWGLVATAYAIGTLALAWRPGAAPDVKEILRPLLALIGVWSLSYVAAGLGVLGTDPFEQNERRTVKPQWVWLYMLVAGGLGYALSTDSIWSVFVALVLTTTLAWALWQKADDHLPVLLDPVTRPVPSLSLPNGLIAVLLFFVIQSVLAPLFLLLAPPSLAVTLGYVVAGCLVILGMRVSLAGVAGLAAGLGLARRPSARALGVGAVAGMAAGALGLGWLTVVDAIPTLRHIRDSTPQILSEVSGNTVWVLAALAVLAAPFFEEWLFRGFLYGGMRRTWGVRRSVLTSALLFAIVHPALGFPAVFGLGAAAALVRERTGSLYAAMVTHAVYNAIVVGIALAV